MSSWVVVKTDNRYDIENQSHDKGFSTAEEADDVASQLNGMDFTNSDAAALFKSRTSKASLENQEKLRQERLEKNKKIVKGMKK